MMGEHSEAEIDSPSWQLLAIPTAAPNGGPPGSPALSVAATEVMGSQDDALSPARAPTGCAPMDTVVPDLRPANNRMAKAPMRPTRGQLLYAAASGNLMTTPTPRAAPAGRGVLAPGGSAVHAETALRRAWHLAHEQPATTAARTPSLSGAVAESAKSKAATPNESPRCAKRQRPLPALCASSADGAAGNPRTR